MGSEDWQHIFDFPNTQWWRVKLCKLGEESWGVFGEGFLRGEYDEVNNEYSLVVEDDITSPTCLFRSKIKAPVSIQKQDTILIWKGPQDDIEYSYDMNELDNDNGIAKVAIGFQAARGCASISEFFLYAMSHQSNDCRPIFTVQYVGNHNIEGEAMCEVVEHPPLLPPLPNKLNLTIVLNSIVELLGSTLGREILIVYLDSKKFLGHIWATFTGITENIHMNDEPFNERKCLNTSPLEKIQMLWTISDIIKQYCLIGDSYLIEEMIDDGNFERVLTMLEYDRAFGTRKANFKDFYRNHTTMKQVFEITDTPVIEKIRRTYRLQLLRDVLVRSADDFNFHILRSLIYLNHSEIIEKLHNSPEFCDNLFGIFDESPYHKVDKNSEIKDKAIQFIYEVMKTSKNFAYSQLRPLYLTLIDSGLVNALCYGFGEARDDNVKIMALESLSILLEFDLSIVLPYREILVRSITWLAAQQEQKSMSSEKSLPSRAVRIEVVEILKRLLLEVPSETMWGFFPELKKVLSRHSGKAVKSNTVILLPFLEIITQCFSTHPEITGALMVENKIWEHLASAYKEDVINGDRSSLNYVDYRRDHLKAQRAMALTRLVREAIQPPVVTSSLLCTEQANCIIKSGLFPAMIRRHISVYMQRNYAHDAEQSSFLNLLYTIVEGRNNTCAQQFKLLADWMINEGLTETRSMCLKYNFISNLLPDPSVNDALQRSLLKRPPHNQCLWPGYLGRQTQRKKMTSPQSSVQSVDEVDVFVLPPSSFTNHFRYEHSEPMNSPRQKNSSHILSNDNNQQEDEDSSSALTTDEATELRHCSPSPPLHPWWSSKSRCDNLGTTTGINNKITPIQPTIHPQEVSGSQQ